MQQNQDTWVLLYQDAIAQVWGRRDIYDDPQLATWVAPANRSINNQLATDSVTWPAIASRSGPGSDHKTN
jgi:hypothetical protein